MSTEIIGNWQSVKNLIDNEHASLLYVDHNDNYFVVANNGSFSVSAVISKNDPADPDLVDFEANYKDFANKKTSTTIHGINPTNQNKSFKVTGIDQTNSTTAPLTAGSTFTGEWFDSEQYSNLTVTVFTDQDSAENGLVVEHSSDGVNVDDSDPYTIFQASGLGGQNRQFSFPLPIRYYRVKYTNGSVDQTEFRLQAKLHQGRPKPSSHRIKDAITEENDAELTKAVLTAQNPNGQFVNSRSDGRQDELSTTTSLSAEASFVSPIVDTLGYLTMDFTVTSDVASATDGIIAEWFLDEAGTQLVKSSPFTYNMINEGAFYNVPTQARYVRLTYTNGADAQSFFFLDTRLRVTPNVGLLSQVEGTLTGDLLAILARAILFGRTESGDLNNVELSNSNSLKVAVTDRPSEVRNRVSININIPETDINTTPGSVIYTVTEGKTLYVQSFVITSLNSASQVGKWTLNDGATPKSTFLMRARESGSTPAQLLTTSPTMPEPMQVTTNIRIEEITGNIFISGYIIGYEE